MQVVLLRVGIDTGSGGILGPLFKDGSFEYIPIPDKTRGRGIDKRAYGDTLGRHGERLVNYFPNGDVKRCVANPSTLILSLKHSPTAIPPSPRFLYSDLMQEAS